LPNLLIGAAFGLCITLIPALIMKSGMVGGADIKMCTALGAFMGPFPFSMALIFSMPFAIIYGIKNKDKSIPLIPFLSIGALISLTIQRIIL
jgi:prepilin signal peptidase PulO-like enzyme (type II secretory pathway)